MPVHTKKERKLKGIKKSSSGKIRKLQVGGPVKGRARQKDSGKKDRHGNPIFVSDPQAPKGVTAGRKQAPRGSTEELPVRTSANILMGPGKKLFVKIGKSNKPLTQKFLDKNKIEFTPEQFEEFGGSLFEQFGISPPELAPVAAPAVPPDTSSALLPLGIPQELPQAPIAQLQTGGALQGIAGVRVPTEDAMMPPAPELQTGGNVSNFNPFQGEQGQAAQGTLSGLIDTGNRSDTSAIKTANEATANRNFEQQTGQINEQLGALGLGSSSARTREVAGASADLQANLAGINANLDFGADEAASNRQLQSFNPFLTGSGQTLQSNIAERGFQTQRGINQANIGSAELQQNRGITAGAESQGSDQDFRTRQQNSSQQFDANRFNALNPGTLGGVTSVSQTGPIQQQGSRFGPTNNPPSRTTSFGGIGVASSPQGTTAGSLKFQTGGRVDFQDTVSKLAFGKLFNKPESSFIVPQFNQRESGPNVGASVPGVGRGSAPPARRGTGVDKQQQQLNAEKLRALRIQNQTNASSRSFAKNREDADRARGASLGRELGKSAANSRVPTEDVSNIAELIGLNRANQGLQQSGRLIMSAGNAVAGANAGQASMQQQIQAFLRGQGQGRQTGGKVPGSPAGGDTVPAEVGQPDGQTDVMLQGQEGIVPLDVMDRLKNFSGQPGEADQIVSTIRDIMGQEEGPRGPEENGEQPAERQVGGSIPTGQQRVQQFTPGVSPQFDQGIQGDVEFDQGSFNLTGDPNAPLQSSGQVSVDGVDQSSQLAGDQLQAAQLRRRAAFFDSLIGTSPQAASERLTVRRDDALGQAAQFEQSAELELQRQSAETISTGRDTAIINQGAGAAVVRAGAAQDGSSEILEQGRKAFFSLTPEQLAALGNPSFESFLIRFAGSGGQQAQPGSPLQEGADRAEQQSVIQGLTAQGNESPLFASESPSTASQIGNQATSTALGTIDALGGDNPLSDAYKNFRGAEGIEQEDPVQSLLTRLESNVTSMRGSVGPSLNVNVRDRNQANELFTFLSEANERGQLDDNGKQLAAALGEAMGLLGIIQGQGGR